ncbi:MAG: regulatory protein RecX [Pseudohongiellaceae bacterium]
MDALARREHSSFELRQKLRQKFPDQSLELIEAVLTQLQEENLQSDVRFVDSYVRYRKARGFGYLHIKSDLSGRGVSGELIETYLIPDDEDWLYIAGELVERRLGEGGRMPFASKTHRKLLRFLESRGFTNAQVRQVLDSRLDDSA